MIVHVKMSDLTFEDTKRMWMETLKETDQDTDKDKLAQNITSLLAKKMTDHLLSKWLTEEELSSHGSQHEKSEK